MAREVVVTGIGLVTGAGIGTEPAIAALGEEHPPVLDSERFAPFTVHPAPALDLDSQIPKKSDQRQMEPWQRLGCYAAGLALDSAGAKSDAELKSRMQVIVAAGGGERDYAADGQILTAIREAKDPGVFLNERLMSDLRPTLFLAQLSNLLAGNISIVHGITGATRTFMGEEQSGVDAIRVAQARIAAGQAEIIMVGGSYNAERPDCLLIFEMGGFLWKKPFLDVWRRPPQGGGTILGSGAAFLVMEAREHADARGATPLAAISGVAADRASRRPGSVTAALGRMWEELGVTDSADVISGASGVAGPTQEEAAALRELAPEAVIRATGDVAGHMVEAQAPAGVALAAALIASGTPEIAVTSVGHWRGEGLVRLVSPS